MGKLTISQEIDVYLRQFKKFGHSKYKDKKIGESDMFFYHKKTYDAYLKKMTEFVRFANQKEGRRLHIADDEDREILYEHITAFLSRKKFDGSSYAPHTLHTDKAIIAKCLWRDLTHIQLPSRRKAIKGRNGDTHRYRIENHQEEIAFYRMSGARKNEYRYLEPEEIVWLENKYGRTYINQFRDGSNKVCNINFVKNEAGKVWCITLKGKGGRKNVAPVDFSKEENRDLIYKFDNDYDFKNKVLNPPTDCNVHDWGRRAYAQDLYNRLKVEDLNTLKDKFITINKNGKREVVSALYYARGERKGQVYDRAALMQVSVALGHSDDRCSDVVKYYMN